MKFKWLIAITAAGITSTPIRAQYDWKVRNSETIDYFKSITFTSGKFFASNGNLFQSVTGESWSQVILSPSAEGYVSTVVPVSGGVLAVGDGYYWPPTKKGSGYGGYFGGG